MSLTPLRMYTTNNSLDATITSSQTESVGYEVANLNDPDRTKQWKIPYASGALTFQMSGNPWIGGLAITGIGYSVDTQFRLRGNTADSGWDSAPFDTGWVDAYPAALPYGAGIYGSPAVGYGGYVTPTQYPYFRPSLIYHFGDNGATMTTWDGNNIQTWAYYRMDFNDPDAGPSIAAGVISLSSVIDMPKNFDLNPTVETVDTTEVARSTSGQPKAARTGTRYDVVSLDFSYVPDTDKWFLYQELKKLGMAQPFFVEMYPDSGNGNHVFTAYYGTLERMPRFGQPLLDYFNMPLNFAETP